MSFLFSIHYLKTMKSSTLKSSILYQNASKTVTLIDIPTSITHAQGLTEASKFPRRLLSTQPLRELFSSPEPKSEKARENLLKKGSIDYVTGEVYVGLIEDALKEVSEQFEGSWCLERSLIPGVNGRKRKADEISNAESGWRKELGDKATNLSEHSSTLPPGLRGEHKAQRLSESAKHFDLLPISSHEYRGATRNKETPDNSLNINELLRDDILHDRPSEQDTEADTFRRGEERLSRILKAAGEGQEDHLKVSITTTISENPEITELNSWDGICHNEYGHPVQITIADEPSPNETVQKACIFYIPPLATLILSDCKDSSKLRNTLRALSSTHNTSRSFSLILLDPPWPNASVKRKAAYSTASALRELKNLILSMDLDQYISLKGYIGIWITNNPSVRKLILGPGGLFEHLNVGLVEEWIWVKTTISGEPVSALDGLWRRPYEVLLLGRAPGSKMEVAHGLGEHELTRRVLFGVPDLHSRKPCLKALFEGLGMAPSGYQALEIFARYCVAGWWSWGNEVLKFAWDGYWDDSLEHETYLD
jgi:N6-adenosine-specific RNA methylase IME4